MVQTQVYETICYLQFKQMHNHEQNCTNTFLKPKRNLTCNVAVQQCILTDIKSHFFSKNLKFSYTPHCEYLTIILKHRKKILLIFVAKSYFFINKISLKSLSLYKKMVTKADW